MMLTRTSSSGSGGRATCHTQFMTSSKISRCHHLVSSAYTLLPRPVDLPQRWEGEQREISSRIALGLTAQAGAASVPPLLQLARPQHPPWFRVKEGQAKRWAPPQRQLKVLSFLKSILFIYSDRQVICIGGDNLSNLKDLKDLGLHSPNLNPN